MIKKPEIEKPEKIDDLAFQVRFRSVGKGDTIIVEAGDNKHRYLGIIDCKRVRRKNPVISYLKYLSHCQVPYTISFVILTHPHRDHCSGVAELFQYIVKYNIDIRVLAHTFHLHPDYPAGSKTATGILLAKIRSGIRSIRARQSNLTERSATLGNGPRIKDIESVFLVPDLRTAEALMDAPGTYDPMKKSNLNQRLTALTNSISTAIALRYKRKYVLLTSDVEEGEFTTIQHRIKEYLKNHVLYSGQIPHHGSHLNFDEKFWTEIERDVENGRKPEAVISGYLAHESPVRKALDQAGYVIRETGELAYTKSDKFDLKLCEISSEVDHGHKDVVIRMPRLKKTQP